MGVRSARSLAPCSRSPRRGRRISTNLPTARLFYTWLTWGCGKTRSFTMTRTMLTLAVGVAISVGGLSLAQTGHGHGKGPTVKTLSAVDVNEQFNGKPTRATTLEVTFAPGALWQSTPASCV